MENIDITLLNSRFKEIEKKWEQLTFDDLEQVGEEINELLKEVKRREKISPSFPTYSNYEIYVRRFESQPTNGEGKEFFVLDRQKMIMYLPSVYKTTFCSISPEDLALNYISLCEVLENCVTLNQLMSISEIDREIESRVIHYLDGKYIIYKEPIGYQIIVGPFGKIKKSADNRDYNWQDDCTIEGCIYEIKKQCIEKIQRSTIQNSSIRFR
jgi:hypothetical protein